MSQKTTVVFHDEELYTDLKVAAASRHITASEIITRAVRAWLENQEDAELLPAIESARAEWKQQGGRPWSEEEQEIAETVTRREGKPEANIVQA